MISYFCRKNDGGNELGRSNDGRESWKERTAEKEHHNRKWYRSEDGGDSLSRWSSGGAWNGAGAARSEPFSRSVASNGPPDRDRDRGMMHNGVDPSNSWNKDPTDVLSHLNRMSHTGINNRSKLIQVNTCGRSSD